MWTNCHTVLPSGTRHVPLPNNPLVNWYFTLQLLTPWLLAPYHCCVGRAACTPGTSRRLSVLVNIASIQKPGYKIVSQQNGTEFRFMDPSRLPRARAASDPTLFRQTSSSRPPISDKSTSRNTWHVINVEEHLSLGSGARQSTLNLT